MKTCKLLRLKNKKLKEKGLRMGVIDEATTFPNLKVCPYNKEKGRCVEIIACGSLDDIKEFNRHLKTPEQSPILIYERKNKTYKVADMRNYTGEIQDFSYCINAVEPLNLAGIWQGT